MMGTLVVNVLVAVVAAVVAFGGAQAAGGARAGLKQPQNPRGSPQVENDFQVAEAATASEVEYLEGPLDQLYDFLIQSRLHQFCKLLRESDVEEIIVAIEGPWTLFAPADSAFALSLDWTLDELKRDPGLLRDFLLRHFVTGDLPTQQIQQELVVPSLQGSPLRFNVYGQIVTVSGAQILEPDLLVGPARVHVIDQSLYPPPQTDLVGHLQQNNDRIYQLVLDAGLADYLSSGTFTFLAPDDRAFDFLSQDLKTAIATNTSLAERILLNHLLPGTVYLAGISDGMTWETVGGAIITFSTRRGFIFANDVPIQPPEVSVTNGVVQNVNRVLLPEGVEIDCQCKPTVDDLQEPPSQSPSTFTRPPTTTTTRGREPIRPSAPARPTPRPSTRPFNPQRIGQRTPVPGRSGQQTLPPRGATISIWNVTPPTVSLPEDDSNVVQSDGGPFLGPRRPDVQRVPPTNDRRPVSQREATPERALVPTPRIPAPQRVPTPQRVPVPSPQRVPVPSPQRVPVPSPQRVPVPAPQRVPVTTPQRVPPPQRQPVPPPPQTGGFGGQLDNQRFPEDPTTESNTEGNEPGRYPDRDISDEEAAFVTNPRRSTSWFVRQPTQPTINVQPAARVTSRTTRRPISPARITPAVFQPSPQENQDGGVPRSPVTPQRTTQRPQSWNQRKQVTSRPPVPQRTTFRPGVIPPGQRRPISSPRPQVTPPAVTEETFQAVCRQRFEPINPTNQNLPPCPETDIEPCQRFPYNANDPRPFCPEDIPTQGCRSPSEPFNPSDRRPSCQGTRPPFQDCRNPGDPFYPGDSRPVCSTPAPTTGCRDPSQPARQSDRRPLCRPSTAVPIAPEPSCRPPSEPWTQGDRRPLCRTPAAATVCRDPTRPHNPSDNRPPCPTCRQQGEPLDPSNPLPTCNPDTPVSGCRSPGEASYPQDSRPYCPEDNVATEDCRPFLERPRPGDRRPVCKPNRQTEKPLKKPSKVSTATTQWVQPPSRAATTRQPSTQVTRSSWQPSAGPPQRHRSPRPGKQPLGPQPTFPETNEFLDVSPYPPTPRQDRPQSTPLPVGRHPTPPQPRPQPGFQTTRPQPGRNQIRPQTPGIRQQQPGQQPQQQQQQPTPQPPRTGFQQPGSPQQPAGGHSQQPRPGQQRPGTPSPGPGAPAVCVRCPNQAGSTAGLPGQQVTSPSRRPSSPGHPVPGRGPSTPRVPISVTGTSPTPGEDSKRSLYEIVEDPALLIRGHPVRLTKIFELFHKAGLEDILTSRGPTTVFLPSDDAFAALPKGVIEQLEEYPDLLRQVLLYHVTNTEVLPSVQSQSFTVPSLQGMQLLVTMLNGGRLILISGAKAIAVTRASNGIFFVINQLLYPLPYQDIVAAVRSRPDLTRLAGLLELSGLAESLQGVQPYTLFAPTDDAFAQLSPAVMQELTQNATALQQILLNHLTDGAHYGREFIAGGTFPSARGGKLKFQVVSYGYKVNDVNVKTPEIVTGTGVIHLVDQVLLEPSDLRLLNSLENSATGENPRSPLANEALANEPQPIGDQQDNVAQLARAMGLNRFANWITNTGLLEKIHDGGVYTIFAPTDDAVNSLPPNVADSIDSNPEQVRPLLKYHIVPQRINLNSVSNEETASTLLEGKSIRFNVYQNDKANCQQCQQLLTASGTPVGQALGTMGSIQVIPVNQVLYQPSGNLQQIVDSSPILQNFSKAIRNSRLSWVLSGSGPVTIFAPSDTAFQSLTDGEKKNFIDNRQAFTDLLKRHMTRGSLFSSGVQSDLQKKSENGDPMAISLQQGIMTVNSIPVSYSDVTATNGVLHVIDQFL